MGHLDVQSELAHPDLAHLAYAGLDGIQIVFLPDGEPVTISPADSRFRAGLAAGAGLTNR